MIYALAEYYKASQDRESLDMAIDLYRTLEAKATDPIYRGYLEGFSANWDYKKGLLISDGEHKDSEKTMNTHLHLLEAYTNLLRVWEDEGLKDRLRQLVDIMTDLVLNKESWHFDVYFDRQWASLTDLVSYGHDIEGSWLLTEAAEVLADRDYIKKVEQISLNIAQTVLDQGLDIDGGLFNEGTRQGPHDRDKYWWPQAEALVGFFNAYQISQDQAFLDACIKCWDFIDSKLVDHKNGEWFEYIDIGGQLAGPDEAKADEWKCPYHNSRACMELLTRLNKKINKK
jgi:mannobiose 2-epimerase